MAGETILQGDIDVLVHYTCTWLSCNTQRRFKLDLIKQVPGGAFKECVNVKFPYSGTTPSSFDSWFPASTVPDLGDLFQAFQDCNLHDPGCTCTFL